MLNSPFPQWLQDMLKHLEQSMDRSPQSFAELWLSNTQDYGSDFVSNLPSNRYWAIYGVFCYIKDGIAIEATKTFRDNLPNQEHPVNYVIRVVGCPYYFLLYIDVELKDRNLKLKHLTIRDAQHPEEVIGTIKNGDTVLVCGIQITFDMLVNSLRMPCDDAHRQHILTTSSNQINEK